MRRIKKLSCRVISFVLFLFLCFFFSWSQESTLEYLLPSPLLPDNMTTDCGKMPSSWAGGSAYRH